jgi:hypothetical protein
LQEVRKKSGRVGSKRAVLRYKIAKPKATEKWDYPFELLSQGERITQNGLSQQVRGIKSVAVYAAKACLQSPSEWK